MSCGIGLKPELTRRHEKRRMGGFNDEITQGAEGALDILCANYYELNKLLNVFTLNFLVHIHTIC